VETAQIVALAAFAVVATGVAFLARRTGAVLQRTRVAEGFRGDVADLGRRIEQSLSDASSMIDAVRRHEAEPPTLHPSLDAARDAVARYTQEARDLGGPLAAVAHREALVFELERANRALELVQHGCDLYETGRRNQRGPEVEIAIKRGYLNLIHARESIADHARAAVEMAEDASPARRFGRR
jgi:hypothetical protein